MFQNLFPELGNFIKEKDILYEELPKKGYRIWIYYLAKLIADFPLNVLNPLLFVPIIYSLGPLNHSFEGLLIFLSISVLLMFCSITFTHIFTAMAPSFEIG